MDRPLLEAFNAPLHVADVTLRVRDLDAMVAYYTRDLGLAVLAERPSHVDLGVDEAVLLKLEHVASAKLKAHRATGLFHTAFLVPSRAALGQWLSSATKRGLTFDGASDHHVSEALYLADPEGNGIEVYADRARSEWKRQNDEIVMATDPLDAKSLLAAGQRLPENAKLPSGTRVGHIHLCVSDLAAADAFFSQGLGFDLTYGRAGAKFFSTGGYHHHVAVNTWSSAGAPPLTGETTGLVTYTLQSSDNADFDRRLAQFSAQSRPMRPIPGGIELVDPTGATLLIRRHA